jgi:hypothetical protein
LRGQTGFTGTQGAQGAQGVTGPTGPVGTTRRTVAGTTDTLTAADKDGVVTYTSNSPIAVTVPTGLGGATFNFECGLVQSGTGKVTPNFAAVTLIPQPHNFTGTAGRGALITVVEVGNETYILGGDGA